MPKTKKEKLKILNQYLHTLDKSNPLLSDEQLDEIIQNTDTDLIKYTSIIDDAIQASKDNVTLKKEFGLSTVNDHITPILFDYRYTNETGKAREEIKEKNKQIVKDLQDPAKRRELIENKLLSLISLDISKITTGSLTQRMKYLSDSLNTTLSLLRVKDLIEEYKRIENPNQELLSLMEEKKEGLELCASMIEMTKLMRQDYYPLMKNSSRHQYTNYDRQQTVKTLIDKAERGFALTETEQIQYDFMNVLNSLDDLSTMYFESVIRESEIFKTFSQYGLLDGGENAVRFYPIYKDGTKISLKTIIDNKAPSGKIFTFKERSQEYVDYFKNGLKGDKPQIVENGRAITFTGYQVSEIKEIPNPVEAKLKPFANETTEAQAAGKWFESFKQYLNQTQDFDPSNKYDTCRIKKFRLGGIGRKDIQLETNFLSKENPDLQTLNFENIPSINELNDAQKLELFRCARTGTLVLNDRSLNMSKMKAIYVKDDGSFGLSSDFLANFTTANNNLQIKEHQDPDIYKKLFPDTGMAKELSVQFGDYQKVRAAESTVPHTMQGTYSTKMALHKYESELLENCRSDPEFYKTKNAGSRMKLIRSFSKQYKSTVDVLTASTGKSLSEILSSGWVSKGGPGYRSGRYIPKPGDQPWDTVDAINFDINNGENVYLKLPGQNGQMKEYRLKNTERNLELKEVLPFNDYRKAHESIKNFAERINATGVTDRDSKEFDALRIKINELADNLTEDKAKFQKQMNDLKKAADQYYFAKLGQSQNSRRRERFSIANEIKNIARSYVFETKPSSKKMMLLQTITDKAYMASLNQLKSNGRNPEALQDWNSFNKGISEFAQTHVNEITEIGTLDAKKLNELAYTDISNVEKVFNRLSRSQYPHQTAQRKTTNVVNPSLS